jgi:hypothetical protein
MYLIIKIKIKFVIHIYNFLTNHKNIKNISELILVTIDMTYCIQENKIYKSLKGGQCLILFNLKVYIKKTMIKR